jgi:hypothetical protein
VQRVFVRAGESRCLMAVFRVIPSVIFDPSPAMQIKFIEPAESILDSGAGLCE